VLEIALIKVENIWFCLYLSTIILSTLAYVRISFVSENITFVSSGVGLPTRPSNFWPTEVAQLVEQLTNETRLVGLNPAAPVTGLEQHIFDFNAGKKLS
jgi:hypothetical protein